MEKYGLVNSLVGKRFPFFLSNHNFKKDSYFLYEVYSPGIDENYSPYVSLKTIANKTPIFNRDKKVEVKAPNILDSFNSRIINEHRIDWVGDLVKNFSDDEIPSVSESQNTAEPFPWISLCEADDETQVRLICNLRDFIRWNNYSFANEKKVDILVSPEKFAIFSIKNDAADNFKLVFENLYSTEDITLNSPLKVKNLDQINNTFCKQSWKRDNKSISNFNRFIKEREYKALLQNS